MQFFVHGESLIGNLSERDLCSARKSKRWYYIANSDGGDVKQAKIYDVLILGGGASGLMCAARLAQESGLQVGVIEGNSKVAAKLRISGGGKCNITNVDVQTKHFLGDKGIVSSALQHFSQEELLQLLKSNGLRPVLRKDRYYFCPKSSDEIITILKSLNRQSTFLLQEHIVSVQKQGEVFIVKTDKSRYMSRHVVVATGGISYATLGATDVGLRVAKAMGHRVIPFAPALVGLTLQPDQFWMKALSGISLNARISVGDRLIEEDVLFAHRGISGPAVLSASLYWHKGSITIDFLPGTDIRRACKGTKKQISSVMALPKRFSKAFLEHIGVSDKACGRLSDEDLDRLGLLHRYSFAPSGTFGFTKAEVSRGGVCTEELQTETLQSRLVDGLYFIGEVVDVTGELGGYNFQWAFSSAVVAADAIIRR